MKKYAAERQKKYIKNKHASYAEMTQSQHTPTLKTNATKKYSGNTTKVLQNSRILTQKRPDERVCVFFKREGNWNKEAT